MVQEEEVMITYDLYRPFKVGDRVICINDTVPEDFGLCALVKGDRYTIDELMRDMVIIKELNTCWHPNRFKLEHRQEKPMIHPTKATKRNLAQEGQWVKCVNETQGLINGAQYEVAEVSRDKKFYHLAGKGGEYFTARFEPVTTNLQDCYDNEPHVHRKVIRAWANGATIECYDSIKEEWAVIQSTDVDIAPNWFKENEYRVAPHQLSDAKKAQIKLQGLKSDLKKLQKEISLLEAAKPSKGDDAEDGGW